MDYLLKAPQVGEAIVVVTIIKYMKNVGDPVAMDEPIMTLETEKAALDVESPVAGRIKEIRFPPGASAAVGEVIVVIGTEAERPTPHNKKAPAEKSDDSFRPVANPADLRNWLIRQRNEKLSPRLKAHCLANNVVPMAMYRELSGDQEVQTQALVPTIRNDAFRDVAIKSSQMRLNQTLASSASQVVSANIQVVCDNAPVEKFRSQARKADSSLMPSRLELVAWAVVNALKQHSLFCSRVVGVDKLREFTNPNIGIAVAMPDDELTIAVVKTVFSYDFEGFVNAVRKSFIEAKEDGYVVTFHSLSITDLSAFGIVNAIPVIAAPATATLFMGKPYLREELKNYFQFSLSFDHRVANGAGAAHFLKDVCRNLRPDKMPIELLRKIA